MEPLGPLVEESLREPVACFRHDLYTPALAMLTGAVEGAFSELGLALADATETDHADLARRLRKLVTEPQTSPATLLDRALAYYYYVDRDLSEPVWNGSGVAAAHIRGCQSGLKAFGNRATSFITGCAPRCRIRTRRSRLTCLQGSPGLTMSEISSLPGSIGRVGQPLHRGSGAPFHGPPEV